MKTISGIVRDQTAAEIIIDKVRAMGVSANDISIVFGNNRGPYTALFEPRNRASHYATLCMAGVALIFALLGAAQFQFQWFPEAVLLLALPIATGIAWIGGMFAGERQFDYVWSLKSKQRNSILISVVVDGAGKHMVSMRKSIYAIFEEAKAEGLMVSDQPAKIEQPQSDGKRSHAAQAKLLRELLGKDQSVVRYAIVPGDDSTFTSAIVLRFDGRKFMTHQGHIEHDDEEIGFYWGHYFSDTNENAEQDAANDFDERCERVNASHVVKVRDIHSGKLLEEP